MGTIYQKLSCKFYAIRWEIVLLCSSTRQLEMDSKVTFFNCKVMYDSFNFADRKWENIYNAR